AVKEFRKRSEAENATEYHAKLAAEYMVSKSLHHPNIVETLDLVYNSNDRWCHVMEYCGGGDLFGLLKQFNANPLQPLMGATERNCLFKQLLMGVNYLHCYGIAHRDIKPENLLLKEDGTLKITDFGVADVIQKSNCDPRGTCRLSKGLCGSEPYISPEVFHAKKAGTSYDARKLDIWSCAIVYICMFYGGNPFIKADEDYCNRYRDYYDATQTFYTKHPSYNISARDAELPTNIKFLNRLTPLPCRRLLWRMLQIDPAKRIILPDILESSWIQGVDTC
ncbi:hypothetical protein CANCADRAFT_19589, partial [Tortispora caseinolytica NRRL Y-17796]